ncbi:MAG: asparaginase [Spirochaetaceae bacterium]|nr:MAG: asparaginase [Spirochaetaceae bacterium]
MKRKILVLSCGGTIIMRKSVSGALKPPDEQEALHSLLSLEPRLNELAEFCVINIANIDSSNMTPALWDAIAIAIHNSYAQFDGFIITHGTDTMAYTAAALCLALQNIGKPVILTGSQIPGSSLNSDARRNMVNAAMAAIADLAGIHILFDERIVQGCRATKASESRLDAFRTVNAPDTARIGTEIQLAASAPRRHSRSPELTSGFVPDVLCVSLTPGTDPSDLEFLLENKRIRGIVIAAFGTGNLPDNFNAFFRKAKEADVPVVITSQCLHGMTRMSSYETGKQALDLGAIEGYDQSLEMLTVKLMWALKRCKPAGIGAVMETNFCGELDRKYLFHE